MSKGKNIHHHYQKYVSVQPREPENTEWELSLRRELRKLGYARCRCLR